MIRLGTYVLLQCSFRRTYITKERNVMNFYKVQQEISDKLGLSLSPKGKDTFKVLSVKINPDLEDTDTTAELVEVQFRTKDMDSLKEVLEDFNNNKHKGHVYTVLCKVSKDTLSKEASDSYTGKLLFMYSKNLKDKYNQLVTI